MVKTKPRPKYQAISLPKDFVEKVRAYVLKSDKYGSIAEFTKIAVKQQMEREKTIEEIQKKKINPLPIMVKEEPGVEIEATTIGSQVYIVAKRKKS